MSNNNGYAAVTDVVCVACNYCFAATFKKLFFIVGVGYGLFNKVLDWRLNLVMKSLPRPPALMLRLATWNWNLGKLSKDISVVPEVLIEA